jgi:inner membrane transporter RhtA
MRTPPELLFVVSGVSMYAGAALAVVAFDYLDPAGVAWWRVIGAGVILALLRRSWRAPWSRRQLLLTGMFGSVLALMNLSFYLAIDRLPLGTAVAIEFAGPIAVAALGSKGRRGVAALLLAVAGVVVLADVQFEANAAGVLFALLAAAFWAGYIVLGARVAAEARAVEGLSVGLLIGALVISPFGAVSAFGVIHDLWLVALIVGVAVLSSVIPYTLDQVILRRIPRERFALLLALLPAAATLMGFAALQQSPSVLELGGIVLVAAGIAVSDRPA